VLRRPAVAGAIIGATTVEQLLDNLGAGDFMLPDELLARLDAVSAPRETFPCEFFGKDFPAYQRAVHGAGATSSRTAISGRTGSRTRLTGSFGSCGTPSAAGVYERHSNS